MTKTGANAVIPSFICLPLMRWPDGPNATLARGRPCALHVGAAKGAIRTRSGACRYRAVGHAGASASYASFSPDGKRLLYWRMFGDNADIVVSNADGSGEKRLTRDPAFDGWPCWAPEGDRIAFARERGIDADVYILDLATGAERMLFGGHGRKTAPKWSEDGSAVLFDRTRDGETGIWRVAVARD